MPYFFQKLEKSSQNLSSAAVLIDSLRANTHLFFHASNNFCNLLTIFANSLDPDQARQTECSNLDFKEQKVSFDLNPNRLTL